MQLATRLGQKQGDILIYCSNILLVLLLTDIHKHFFTSFFLLLLFNLIILLVFIQDSALCNVFKILKKYFNYKKISCLDWPKNSPYQNPTKNLQTFIKVGHSKIICTAIIKQTEVVYPDMQTSKHQKTKNVLTQCRNIF